MKQSIEQRMIDAQCYLNSIDNSKKYFFSDLKPSDLKDGLAVVYVINDTVTGETLYVGRTKNLRQRLYNNHLMGPKSNARLKKYLVEDNRLPEIETMNDAKLFLRKRCYFQYMAVEDVVQRGQIEGLLSFLLDVRYMHEEH